MTDLLYDAVARIARHEADARSWATIAVVTDVHPALATGQDHAASVRLRDSDVVVPRLPLAVGALGFAATPAVGDAVVVVFADGDPHHGIVVGRLYHRDLPPPPHEEGQLVLRLPPGSSSPDIDVTMDPAGPELTLQVGETRVAIAGRSATVTVGSAELVVDGEGAGGVTVSDGQSSVRMDGAGNLALEAAVNLTLKAGADVEIEGSTRVVVNGAIVQVN